MYNKAGQYKKQRHSNKGKGPQRLLPWRQSLDRKSTRLNSSHQIISYAVFCLKKKKKEKKDEHNAIQPAMPQNVTRFGNRPPHDPAAPHPKPTHGRERTHVPPATPSVSRPCHT